jgi:hypothetical protein
MECGNNPARWRSHPEHQQGQRKVHQGTSGALRKFSPWHEAPEIDIFDDYARFNSPKKLQQLVAG